MDLLEEDKDLTKSYTSKHSWMRRGAYDEHSNTDNSLVDSQKSSSKKSSDK